MSAFFPLPHCGVGEGSHVMKSARGLSHFIKLEHVAVHGNLNKTYPRRVLHIQVNGSVKLGGLHGKRGSEFKTKFVKYPNKEHTSTALGSLPLVRLGHVTELFPRIDCAITSIILAVILSDQNNPTNGFFYRGVPVCNRKVFKYRNSPGDDSTRSESKHVPMSSHKALRMRP